MVEASVEHDCECKCDGEETPYELFVGDKSLCTKEQCEQKVSECTTANSAKFVSCMCWCGGDDGGLHRNLFRAEGASECTEETCANEFPNECPAPALETATNENIPVFLDCSCGCQDETNSSDVEYKERLASDGSATKCSEKCKNVMKDECASETHIEFKYTGPVPEPRMSYDCECGCDSNVFEIMVEDASKCTEATCREKRTSCMNANAVEAKYMDCMCDCCKGSACPHLVHNLFRSGNMESCTRTTCSEMFKDVCPEPTGPSNDENFATYLDCNCQCVGASDNEYTRISVGSRDACNTERCRGSLSTNACENGMEVVAHYTGSVGGSKAAIALSREEAAGVAVSLTLVALALLFFFGYRCYQRRYRGYHWHACEHDDDESGVTSLRQKHGCELCANTNTNDEDEDDLKKVAVVVSKRDATAAAAALPGGDKMQPYTVNM